MTVRPRLIAGACALAFFAFASSAHADSLAIHSPADGSNHSTPPTDITGDSHDDWIVGVHGSSIVGHVQRKFPDNTFSAFGVLWTRSFLLCACSDWALSDGFSVGTMPTTDGQYRIQVTQQGLLVSDDTQTSTYTIDTLDPETSLDLGPNEFDTDTTPVFEFSGTDPDPPNGLGSGIDHFECSLDGAPFTNCNSGDTVNAPEGDHELQVRAVDKAGNSDPTPWIHEWMVDTTPPDVTITGPAPKQRFLLHEGSPAFSCTDPLSGGPPQVASGIDTCDETAFDNETLGPHEFEVEGTDNAGNVTTQSVAYVIDPPRYGDFVLEDDPVAYYRHSEPYPSDEAPQEMTMEDSSGSGHHGTYKNNVALGRQGAIACERRPHPPRACETAGDPENRAAFFPERDGYGYVNGIPASPTGYTMEAWIKPRTAGPMMVMSHGRAGQLYVDHNQRLAFEQSQDPVVSSPGPNLPVGEWTHVAATWDGHNTRLYVNGVQVAHSTTANKTPSGTSTLYVGYGEKAPWFHGEIDESALYDHALSAHRIADRHNVGTARDNPSVEAGNSPLNTEGPFTDPQAPKNGGLYAPGKAPDADFACTDPDDVPGNSDVASCTAEVDGNPIASGDPLPDSLGPHSFVVTAVDEGGNEYVHPHQYTVQTFEDIYLTDAPVAYYRLGDGPGMHMEDSSAHERHGEYKNDQDQGPVGIAGDGDTARDFRGAGGYGYANGIPAPTQQMTLEAWIEPDDMNRDQSIAGHGDGGEIFLEGGVLKFRHGPQNRVVSSSPPYAPNPNSSFTQVVATWDGVDLRIYVNGELEGTLESNRGPSSNSTFYVGYGEVKQWFDGRIDEVAYYATALNANRVRQHFLADPAADGARGSGGAEGGGSGEGGESGDGNAPGAGKLGLRVGDAVTPAGKKAMVALYGGEEPATGTVAIDAGKRHLGEARFALDAGEERYVNVKLSKKGRKTLRKKRFVTVTIEPEGGQASASKLRVSR